MMIRFPDNAVFTLELSSTGGGRENQDETIQMTINVDDEIQMFELKNNKDNY